MYFHRILLLIFLGLYMVVPLVIDSWQSLNAPWYLPYIAWLFIILLAYFIERRTRDV